MTEFTTPKGTILPILTLKGKDYLQVAHRLVWFREEHPNWGIRTEFIHEDKEHAVCKASIFNDQDRIMATGHKSETKQGFFNYREKAETGAVGRALALCGFGTQFCGDELDEHDSLADAPISRPKVAPNGKEQPRKADILKATKEDFKLINDMKEALGWDKNIIEEVILERFNLTRENYSQMTKEQAEDLLTYMGKVQHELTNPDFNS